MHKILDITRQIFTHKVPHIKSRMYVLTIHCTAWQHTEIWLFSAPAATHIY